MMTGTIEKIEKLKSFEKVVGKTTSTKSFEVNDPLNINDEQKYIAQSRFHILVYGETGVGKEVLAKSIQKAAEIPDDKYIALNCAGLSKELLESELFGHEKGAFTGAISKKKGLVEEFSNGIIFLDEINSMPLSVQAKLLRFLDNKEYRPIGSNKVLSSNCMIIAAGNENIRTLVNNGTFREDLYFRLRTFELYIPPLRKRRDIIPILIKRLSELNIHDDCLRILSKHDYRGNVRELKIILDRLYVLNKGEKNISDTKQIKRILNEMSNEYEYSNIIIPKEIHGKAFIIFRQILANAALSQTSNNAQEAARILGLSHGSVVKKYAEGKD